MFRWTVPLKTTAAVPLGSAWRSLGTFCCLQDIGTRVLELEEARDAVARVEREYDLLEEQVPHC